MTKTKEKPSFWDFIHAKRQFYYLDFSMVCLICLGLGVVIQMVSPYYGAITMGLALTIIMLRGYDIYRGYQKGREEKA